MIDERGMNPADLTTIPIYQIDNNFAGNGSTGQKLGTIEVPKDLEILRPPTVLSDGTEVNGNSTVTIIQPDGEEDNFARTYIGPNASLDPSGGNVLIGGPVGHGAAWIGNEGEITTAEMEAANSNATAPAHALDLTVSDTILNNSDGGKVGPALYADSGYLNGYTGTNTNLKAGSHLAVPKDVTAQSLGLTTNLGKALLTTMEDFGGYVDDTTDAPGITPDAQYGAAEAVGLPESDYSGFQTTAFANDFSKIMAAAEIVPPTPNS
jgi:hypothetical protein